MEWLRRYLVIVDRIVKQTVAEWRSAVAGTVAPPVSLLCHHHINNNDLGAGFIKQCLITTH